MFDATGLVGGTYDGIIRILSNDPDSGLIEVPATLDVTGVPVQVPDALEHACLPPGALHQPHVPEAPTAQQALDELADHIQDLEEVPF